MVERDMWESASGLDRHSKGDRVLQHKVAERRRAEDLRQNRLIEVKNAADRMRKAQKERGVLNRLKGFFMGTTIGGKPHGSAILRKDLFARFKRGKR